MLTPGSVDVPSGAKQNQPKTFATVFVGKDGSLRLKTRDSERALNARELGDAHRLMAKKPKQRGSCGDHRGGETVSYDNVVKAMDALQRAGVQRVGLSVKQELPGPARLQRTRHAPHSPRPRPAGPARHLGAALGSPGRAGACAADRALTWGVNWKSSADDNPPPKPNCGRHTAASRAAKCSCHAAAAPSSSHPRTRSSAA